MQNNNLNNIIGWNEPAINAGGLKALLIGCEVAKKPEIVRGLLEKFQIDYIKLPSRYPFSRYLEMLEWLRLKLFPYDKEELGYEKIGRNICKGFFLRPVGQVLKPSISIIGHQRSVHYFFRIAGGALAFGEFKIQEERPGYIRAVLYNVPGSPELMRGMGLESMEIAGITNGKITYKKLTSNDTQFEAVWQN